MTEQRRQLKDAIRQDHTSPFVQGETDGRRVAAIKGCYLKRADAMHLETMKHHFLQTHKSVMAADRERLRKQRMQYSADEMQFGINRADFMNKTLALGLMGETALVPDSAEQKRLKNKQSVHESSHAYGLPDELFLSKEQKKLDKEEAKKVLVGVKE